MKTKNRELPSAKTGVGMLTGGGVLHPEEGAGRGCSEQGEERTRLTSLPGARTLDCESVLRRHITRERRATPARCLQRLNAVLATLRSGSATSC